MWFAGCFCMTGGRRNQPKHCVPGNCNPCLPNGRFLNRGIRALLQVRVCFLCWTRLIPSTFPDVCVFRSFISRTDRSAVGFTLLPLAKRSLPGVLPGSSRDGLGGCIHGLAPSHLSVDSVVLDAPTAVLPGHVTPPPTSTTSIFMSHFLSTPPLLSPRFSPREIGLEILFSSLFPLPIPRLPRNLGSCCFSTPIFERPFLSSPLPRIPPSFDFEALFFPIGDVSPVLGIIDDVSTWLSGAFGTQPSEVRNRRGVGRDTTVS